MHSLCAEAKIGGLTLRVGAVQFGLEQHPEAGNLLTFQLIQAGPHVVTDQVQLFTETPVLSTPDIHTLNQRDSKQKKNKALM